MNKRWTYKVVDVKPKFLGARTDDIQEELDRLGKQGWELVQVLMAGVTARLFLKKEQQ